MSGKKSKTPGQSDPVLARLLDLHPRSIDLTLGRLTQLLKRLKHPERKLPPVIHVAGTNGKGSTIAIMRAILEAAGLRVHVYTSPHLVQFRERIRMAGKLIEDHALAEILEECKVTNAGDAITFFEITTAAAFLAFSRAEADICLLEVGLGGRLDATNVIDKPLISVITPVHLDHQDYLGNNLTVIAREKAGIIKANVPVVLGPQPRAAFAEIEKIARAKNATAVACHRDWTVEGQEKAKAEFLYSDNLGELRLPKPALAGAHQYMNAGLAVAVLRSQARVPISESAIRAGMGWVRWPGRLQKIDSGPLIQELPSGYEVWVDGGHNPAAAKILAAEMRRRAPERGPLYLVVGMTKSKKLKDYLKPFAGLAEQLYAVPLAGGHDYYPPADIAAEANRAGFSGRLAINLKSAISAIGQETLKVPPTILITGSLYLAGEALSLSGLVPD